VSTKERKLLCISGLDPTGEAGLLRDISVATFVGVRAGGVVTCLVDENVFGVRRTSVIDSHTILTLIDAFLAEQRAAVTKIGLVPPSLARDLAAALWERRDALGTIVLDPVMEATAGGHFYDADDTEALRALVALATVVTPNVREATALVDTKTRTAPLPEELCDIAMSLMKMGPEAVVITGVPEGSTQVSDYFFWGSTRKVFSGAASARRVRGTGCAFSSALASFLVMGAHLPSAVERAGELVRGWINRGVYIGADTYGLSVVREPSENQ
jgi:hydroxymethylpyrimidine kinase/phosphomethylpyrimidine kinase